MMANNNNNSSSSSRIRLEKTPLEIEESENLTEPEQELYKTLRNYVDANYYGWDKFPVNLPKGLVDQFGGDFNEFFDFERINLNKDFKNDKQIELENEFGSGGGQGGEVVMGHNQMEAVKRRGTFKTGSSKYTIWPLSGTEKLLEDLLDNISFSLRFVLVYMLRLLFSDELSFKSGLKEIWNGIKKLVDLFVGLAQFKDGIGIVVERKVQEERAKFLVAELVCKNRLSVELGRYVRRQMDRAGRERIVTLGMARPPGIPYRFCAHSCPDIIDLRLFDRLQYGRLLPKLKKILEKLSQNDRWFMREREKIIQKLIKNQNKDELEFEANRLMMDSYFELLREHLIDEIGGDFSRLLIEQARAGVLMERSLTELSNRLKRHENYLMKEFRGCYPLLSRDEVWLEMELEKGRREWLDKNKWMGHEICIEYFDKELDLVQSSYFLHRDLAFLKDTSTVLRSELEKELNKGLNSSLIPKKIFNWNVYQWNSSENDLKTWTTSTSYSFYRLKSILNRSIVLTCNTMKTLLITILWNSRLSIRSLISLKPYPIEYEIVNDVKRGVVFNPSFVYFIRNLWVRNDKKGLGWKLFMSFIYGLFWPVGVIFVSGGCILLAFTAWIWCPVVSILHYLFSLIFYDLDEVFDDVFPLGRVLFQIMVGILKTIICFICGLICPFICGFLAVGSLLYYGLRLGLEKLLFLWIRQQGFANYIRKSIPKDNSEHVFYEISRTQTLLLLKLKLEEEELNYWKNNKLKKLNLPQLNYSEFCKKILKPFGVKLDNTFNPYKALIRDTEYYTKLIHSEVGKRKLILNELPKHKLRVKFSDLISILEIGRVIVKEFFLKNVFIYFDEEFCEVDFWKLRGLENYDWSGLTYLIFCGLFGESFLMGVGPFDKVINIENAPREMSKELLDYISRVEEFEEFEEEMLPMTRTEYKIRIPYVGLNSFNPILNSQMDLLECPSLCIPLPILHPVYISVIIYNRETDHPFDIENPICQAVIKSIIAVQDSCINRDCISLEIDSDSSESNSESENEADDVLLEYKSSQELDEGELRLDNSLVSSRFFLGTSV